MMRLPLLWVTGLLLSANGHCGSLLVQNKFADFDGVQVHYAEASEKANQQRSALVFIHGWTCNADFWKKSITQFPGYRAIAIDLPGHGRSDKPRAKKYTIDFFARSIEAVFQDAKVSSAVLIGHSMGVPVIRQFYRLYPQQTQGLIFVDGSLRLESRADMKRFEASLVADYHSEMAKAVEAMVEPIQDKRLKNTIRKAMLETPGYVGLSAMEGVMDDKVWAQDVVSVPVLAILAQSSGWKEDTEASFRSLAPNLEFHTWQGVSHFLMMERPKDFNRAVESFVSKNDLLQ